MGSVISIFSRKGGIGKTTSCVCIGNAFALQGKKVLMVDADAQCSMTLYFFGNDEALYPEGEYNANNGSNLKTVLEDGVPVTDAILEYRFTGRKPGDKHRKECRVDILPGDRSLEDSSLPDFHVLAGVLDSLRNKYDYIILDCPPAWNIVTASVLVASDYILIPLMSNNRACLDGYGLTLNHIMDIINSGENPDLTILGSFLTFTKPNRKAHKRFAEDLTGVSADIGLFDTVIRDSEQPIQNSWDECKPLWSLNPHSVAAECYYELAEEIDERIRT